MKLYYGSCSSAAMSLALLSVPATAEVSQVEEPAPPVSSAPARADNYGDIVVTAQKRQERALDVGLSITAATGAQLEQRGITNVSGLTRLEPSLQYSESFSGAPIYTIRGVGFFEQGVTAPPAVSLYQDEVPYAFPIMSAGALLDVQRVEVLKGPQGTLYGQNSTGGAVNFISNKPTDVFSAGVTGSYGRFGAAELEGFVSGPLTPTLTMRVSGKTQQGGAWQKSNTRDDKLGDRNFWAGRVLTRWEPNERFNATLNINGWQDKSETQAGQLAGFWLLSPAAVSPNNPDAHVPTPEIIASGVYPDLLQAVVENPISPTNNRAADWLAGTHPSRNMRFLQAALRMELEVSDGLNLTSITNFQRFNNHDLIDVGGVNTFLLRQENTARVRAFSQEVRASGTILDGKLNWLIGANYSREKSSASQIFFNKGGSGSYVTNPPFDQDEAVLNPTTDAKSIFGNISYEFARGLKLNGGIRYTKSKLDFLGCFRTTDPALHALYTSTLPLNSCVTFLADGTQGPYRTVLKESSVPWRLGIDWKVTADTLLYVVASKGYKAGASPTTAAAVDTQFNPVKQESILSYEAGVKASLLDRKLVITAAAFHYDYSDKQFLGRTLAFVFGPIQSLVSVPKSKVDGAELSASLRVNGLTIDASGTFLHSKVKSDFSNYNPYGQVINFKGERFPFAPKFAGSAGIRYDWEVGNLAPFVALRGTYQSRTVSSFGNDVAVASGYPTFAIKPYGLIDLSAGIQSADRQWRVELWGRNITNTHYWNSANYSFDAVTRLTGRPATYGFTVSHRFGGE